MMFTKNKAGNLQETAIKALAIVGLFSLLVIGSFAAISAAPYASSALKRIAAAAVTLSSQFTPAQNITLSADSYNIVSGNKLTLSWYERSPNAGSYVFSYPCLDGFYFKAETINGVETVFCNTPFRFINTNNTLTLIPVSIKNRFVDMPVTISFTPNNTQNSTEKDTITVTVTNSSLSNSSGIVANQTQTERAQEGNANLRAAGAAREQVVTIPTNTPHYTELPNGKADLKVSIIEVGVVDKITNAFVRTGTLKRNDRIAVRFAVENVGTKTSPEWRFNGILPTFPPYTYNSDAQPVLAPGDRIEFTLGFDQALQGTSTVKIVVDPQQSVNELSEDNNIVTVDIFTQ